MIALWSLSIAVEPLSVYPPPQKSAETGGMPVSTTAKTAITTVSVKMNLDGIISCFSTIKKNKKEEEKKKWENREKKRRKNPKASSLPPLYVPPSSSSLPLCSREFIPLCVFFFPLSLFFLPIHSSFFSPVFFLRPSLLPCLLHLCRPLLASLSTLPTSLHTKGITRGLTPNFFACCIFLPGCTATADRWSLTITLILFVACCRFTASSIMAATVCSCVLLALCVAAAAAAPAWSAADVVDQLIERASTHLAQQLGVAALPLHATHRRLLSASAALHVLSATGSLGKPAAHAQHSTPVKASTHALRELCSALTHAMV